MAWILLLLFGNFASGLKVEQVTLSYMGDPTAMAVTWITHSPLKDKSTPAVYYGNKASFINETRKATVTEWTDEGDGHTVRYTYRALMSNLVPGKKYHYAVGSEQGNSSTFSFRALDPQNQLRVAIFGDLSVKEGHSILPLSNAVAAEEIDIIIHIGDIAYDLDAKDGNVGDAFMNTIENITAFVPYMVIAGNHEVAQNFSHITNRFTMPPNGIVDDNQFWSFTLGNVHVIGISSEYYGENISSFAELQYQWLKNDLQQSSVAWNVLVMHRPMYCSNDKKHGCQDYENVVMRDGAPGYPSLETLFNSGGVDLVFWGHKHSYERSFPVFNSTVYTQKDTQHFHNAATPVYIMSGAAGCHSHTYPEEKIKQKFTAEMLGEYGYNILTVVSSSLMTTEFVDAKDSKNRLDRFYLSKDPGFRPGQRIVVS